MISKKGWIPNEKPWPLLLLTHCRKRKVKKLSQPQKYATQVYNSKISNNFRALLPNSNILPISNILDFVINFLRYRYCCSNISTHLWSVYYSPIESKTVRYDNEMFGTLKIFSESSEYHRIRQNFSEDCTIHA